MVGKQITLAVTAIHRKHKKLRNKVVSISRLNESN